MKLKIKGGTYKYNEVNISGSKNSAVAIICAATLCDEEVIINNVPNITDVEALIDILTSIGFIITFSNNTVVISDSAKILTTINNEKVKNLRGSYYLIGSFLSKYKKICIPYSGGCNLGYRPINYHLDGFKKMGAKIIQKDELLMINAKNIHGTMHYLPFPSVGATINLMLAACKASSSTVIKNAATEPEIEDVANFLNSMGAKITGAGTNTIIIDGVDFLHSTNYTIMSDRIEAGTYLLLGALHNKITINNINHNYLKSLLDLLNDIGFSITKTDNTITIERNNQIKSFEISIGPYPSFPTDLGPLLTVLALTINGISKIEETIFEDRFSHINGLKDMNAEIVLVHNQMIIQGNSTLKGAHIKAYDLRGAAALVIASTIPNEETTIDNIDVFLRGYENPIEKLQLLGIEAYFIE